MLSSPEARRPMTVPGVNLIATATFSPRSATSPGSPAHAGWSPTSGWTRGSASRASSPPARDASASAGRRPRALASVSDHPAVAGAEVPARHAAVAAGQVRGPRPVPGAVPCADRGGGRRRRLGGGDQPGDRLRSSRSCAGGTVRRGKCWSRCRRGCGSATGATPGCRVGALSGGRSFGVVPIEPPAHSRDTPGAA